MNRFYAYSFVVAALALFLSACATPPQTERSQALSRQDLLAGDVFGLSPEARLKPVVLTAVTDDMRTLLDQTVSKDMHTRQKVEAILGAILENGLQLNYNNFKTYTAEEAFYTREGNCLSFTNLFVALAREAGLDTYYQEVQVPPTWAAQGETFLYNLHINALVDLGGLEQVVDFDMTSYDEKYRRKRLPDDAALAQYHNNMGVYWLGEKQFSNAFLHFRAALDLYPNAAYVWTNLGTLYRRGGHMGYAEASFLEAIEMTDEPAAMSNLSRLYTQIDEPELAQYYEDRVQLFRRRNPYYLFHLAEEAYAGNDFSEAAGLLKGAIRKRPEEHEFHRLLGLTWLKMGKTDDAELSFTKAGELASSPESTTLLARKLQLLSQRH